MARFTRSEIRKIVGDACTEEMESALVALHLSVVDPLKDDVQKYKAAADKLEEVQNELNTLKAKGSTDWETKYNDEHAAFEKYKTDQGAKEARSAKKTAVQAYFESKGITGANLTIAMRGMKDADVDALDLDEKGQIKKTDDLDALVAGDYAALVVTTKEKSNPAKTPPAKIGAGGKTRDEIMSIKDVGERQKAIAENMSVFGY